MTHDPIRDLHGLKLDLVEIIDLFDRKSLSIVLAGVCFLPTQKSAVVAFKGNITRFKKQCNVLNYYNFNYEGCLNKPGTCEEISLYPVSE